MANAQSAIRWSKGRVQHISIRATTVQSRAASMGWWCLNPRGGGCPARESAKAHHLEGVDAYGRGEGASGDEHGQPLLGLKEEPGQLVPIAVARGECSDAKRGSAGFGAGTSVTVAAQRIGALTRRQRRHFEGHDERRRPTRECHSWPGPARTRRRPTARWARHP